jgi:hypothetical protein
LHFQRFFGPGSVERLQSFPVQLLPASPISGEIPRSRKRLRVRFGQPCRCQLLEIPLSRRTKSGYYVRRVCLCQARYLASGHLRHPLSIDHADTRLGWCFFRKICSCNICTHSVRSAGIFLFTSIRTIPHFGFGFAFRFRCSRTALHQTLLRRSGRAAGSFRQSCGEMCSGVYHRLPGFSRLS